jgi:hypothetical protein
MGIHPDIFGPYVWASIHLICLGAPSVLDSSQKTQYKTFFNLLPSVLPCRNCGKHLEENLQHLPIDSSLNSSNDLFNWSVKLHNLVNLQLHKPQITEDDARNFWMSAPTCAINKTGGVSTYNDPSQKYTISLFILLFIIGTITGYFMHNLFAVKLRNKK